MRQNNTNTTLTNWLARITYPESLYLQVPFSRFRVFAARFHQLLLNAADHAEVPVCTYLQESHSGEKFQVFQ